MEFFFFTFKKKENREVKKISNKFIIKMKKNTLESKNKKLKINFKFG